MSSSASAAAQPPPAAALIEYPPVRQQGGPAGPAGPALTRGADGVLRYGYLAPALTELLDSQVHAFADREAVVEVGGPRLTYRQLWHSASRIAGGLQQRGLGYGDRVAIHLPVGARWVQAFLGALLSGAVPVLVHAGLPARVTDRILADSEADFVLGGAFPDGPAFIDDGAALDELALLCYTSGATALRGGASPQSKGVELTNENLLSAISSMVAAMDLRTEGLRNLVLSPLAHASGCVDQLLPSFAVGGTVVLAPTSPLLARALRGERIDMVSATPRVLARLLPEVAALRADGLRTEGISRISVASHRAERAWHSADPVNLTVQLREAFPAARQWSVWGATETSGIGLAVDDNVAATPGALGFPFGGTELALSGPRARVGRGELLCRGPNVTRRYWNDPRATAAHFTGSWFHTGHQVRIDADGLVHRASA